MGNQKKIPGDVSKNSQGGLKHRHVKAKVVDAYENKKDRQRCIVTVFKKYKYHWPENMPNAFYLRPLANPKTYVWYAVQPIGRHKLANVVADMCKEGGLPGYRTNHSLRASAASRLYDQQVDEQMIDMWGDGAQVQLSEEIQTHNRIAQEKS